MVGHTRGGAYRGWGIQVGGAYWWVGHTGGWGILGVGHTGEPSRLELGCPGTGVRHGVEYFLHKILAGDD